MLGVICEVQDQVVGVNWEVQGRMGRAICTNKAPNGIRIRESRLQTRILDRNRNLQHEFANSGSNWDSDLRVWAADLKSHPRPKSAASIRRFWPRWDSNSPVQAADWRSHLGPKSAASIRRFWFQLGLQFASAGCRLKVLSGTEICSLK